MAGVGDLHEVLRRVHRRVDLHARRGRDDAVGRAEHHHAGLGRRLGRRDRPGRRTRRSTRSTPSRAGRPTRTGTRRPRRPSGPPRRRGSGRRDRAARPAPLDALTTSPSVACSTARSVDFGHALRRGAEQAVERTLDVIGCGDDEAPRREVRRQRHRLLGIAREAVAEDHERIAAGRGRGRRVRVGLGLVQHPVREPGSSPAASGLSMLARCRSISCACPAVVAGSAGYHTTTRRPPARCSVV